MAKFKVVGLVGDCNTQVTHVIVAENSDEAYLEFKLRVAKESPEGTSIEVLETYEVTE